jgi:hypothetical protein
MSDIFTAKQKAEPPPIYFDWTKANGDSVAQLTAVTGDPGYLWPYPANALPLNIAQGFPNTIRDCFISGYLEPQKVEGNVTAIGELLITRDHATPESGKAYIYVVAIDENLTPYYRGPYKPYPEHYYHQKLAVPVDRLFGRVKLDNLDERTV